MSTDQEERLVGYGEKFAPIERALAGIPGVKTEVARYENFVQMGLHITLDAAATGRSAERLAEELLDGDPRIRVTVETDDTISIIAHTLSEGEEQVVADRLKGLLSG